MTVFPMKEARCVDKPADRSQVQQVTPTSASALLPANVQLQAPTDRIAPPEALSIVVDEPQVAFIGPLYNRVQLRRWALVLQSQSIAYAIVHDVDGWVLRVTAHDHARAVETIELYEEENKDWPPKERLDTPRHPPSPVMALVFLAAVAFFFSTTGPVRRYSEWFANGTADARLLFTEPWRMITALTLHADGTHVLGNAISGTIFSSIVARRLGAGGALLAVILAGAAGNAANALYYLFYKGEGHRSIGASTAVFAAVGLLAAVQTAVVLKKRNEPLRRPYTWIDIAGPVIGGLALLGSLGSSPDSDLSAHGFGFLAGVLIGGFVAIFVTGESKPSSTVQWTLGLAAAGVLWGSWALALLT